MFTVYITAHRGMGITAKRRNLLIKNAQFYPENSIAAFKEGLRLGADALECDIHVSKDNIALVIHGNKITDYAYYIGTDKSIFENDEKKTSETFTKREIQDLFALKTYENVNLGDVDWESKGKQIALNYYKNKVKLRPDFYQIPTLTQLLEVVADENVKRLSEKRASVKLNIELKGKNSGFVTLSTISDFNIQRETNKKNSIELADIILLGKIEVGEATIAKNILNHADQFIKACKSLSDKDRHQQLSLLFGQNELHNYFSKKGWSLFLIATSPMTEKDLSNNLPPKAILLSKDNKVYYVKNKKLFREGPTYPKYFQIHLTDSERKLLEENISTNNFLQINEMTQEIILKTGGIPSTYSETPQEYQHGKICERIAAYEASRDDGNKILKKEQLIWMKKYLTRIKDLKKIRTNTMLASGELYGANSLVEGNEDFDVKSDIITISMSGYRLIIDCFTQGYDGIDVSLFDFDEKTYEAILEGIGNSNRVISGHIPIIGVTASNWKGVVSEKSPVSPAQALMKAQIISKRLNIDILMKVDEPGMFKELQKVISNQIKESERVVILDGPSTQTIESESVIIDSDYFETISESKLKWLEEVNYDVTIPVSISGALIRTEKPPRGPSKRIAIEESFHKKNIEQNADYFIHLAATGSDKEILKHLLENEALLHSTDWCGSTPLMHAIKGAHLSTVCLFLNYPLNLNVRNQYGNTAILIAAEDLNNLNKNIYAYKDNLKFKELETQLKEIISVLIYHRADLSIMNSKGLTVEMILGQDVLSLQDNKSRSLDKRWFTDNEMNTLLKYFFGNNENIRLLDAINASFQNGYTLFENLKANQLQQTLEESHGYERQSTLIMPINLGNQHWVGLYIHFPIANRLAPIIRYFDPYGHAMPNDLKGILKRLYHNLNKDWTFESPVRFQYDDYNCGPWVIAIFEKLVDSNGLELPNQGFDINHARKLYSEILNNVPNKGPLLHLYKHLNSNQGGSLEEKKGSNCSRAVMEWMPPFTNGVKAPK